MGFVESTETLEVRRKDTNRIEIHSSSEHEERYKLDTVTTDYLFCKTLAKLPANIEISVCNISEMQLSRCELTGLPMNFGLLNLKRLNLSHNELKEVPVCLYSGLKYLEDLNLSYNSISTFNQEPEWLLNIKKIKLNNNCFESLPSWVLMFKSTNLEGINFSTNKAVHYRYLKNSYNLHIMRLKKLKLKNSHLIDEDFGFLKCLEQLQYLDISNKHNKSINKHYEIEELFVKPRWRQMKVLKMNNLLLPFFPVTITSLVTLTELHINNNCISWLPDGIEFMINLVVLDISRNSIVTIFDKLTKLIALEVLKASSNYIEYVPDLTSMPALRVLDLYDNLLEEVCYNHDSVRSIDLENNYLITDAMQDIRYVEKREEMRLTKGSYELRTDGPKLRECEDYDSCSYNSKYSESVDEDSDTSTTDQVVIEFVETSDKEDWDSPNEEIARNSGIDSVDQEWKGFEYTSDVQTVNKMGGVCIDDEDWMFVDVE